VKPLARQLRRSYQLSAIEKMLAFANGVAVPITHFVGFEVFNLIEMVVRIGPLTAGWPGAGIAVFRMEVVVYVAMETFGTMEPWACADKDAAGKPLWAVVAVGSALVGRGVIVAIGTYWRDSDIHGYLSLRFWCAYRETHCSNSGYRKQFKFVHSVLLI
jgi:hypothetical protein